MILYQLAKWMEERTRLKKTIHDGEGDVGKLQRRKEQVEEQLMTQASLWLEGKVPTLEEEETPADEPAAMAFAYAEAGDDLAVLSQR